MRNITGPPVEGDDFFGRENEIDYVWNRIENGNNIIFPSPRRVGKTSFALKLIDIAKEKNWNVVTLNLERVVNEHQFIEVFIDKLKELSWWAKIKDKGNSFLDLLKQVKPKVSHGGFDIELEWKTNKENIYTQLSDILNHESNTLIFLDEVTVLLTSIIKKGEDGKDNVGSFLHWLRDIRITAGSKIRWIYCSSVGIENFTHEHRLSDTVNDISKYNLKSYTKEESMKMLENLGATNNLTLNEAIQTAIVSKLDYCLPFFLQIFFEKIQYFTIIEQLPLNAEIVDIAYKSLIEENHFNTWAERIDEQYGENKTYTFIILKHICRVTEGTKRENLLNILVAAGLGIEKAEENVSLLLYMLYNDGYLMEENALYRFRSPLLRDFWFNRFVK